MNKKAKANTIRSQHLAEQMGEIEYTPNESAISSDMRRSWRVNLSSSPVGSTLSGQVFAYSEEER
jgi:hypothetical protein